PAPSAPTTAQHITVSKPAPVIPLSRPQVLDLLHHTPDYGPPGGPLGDPSRRTSCLSGLGYPASTPVLGAQPIDIDARPAVLLVIPADTPDKLAVFAVAPHCSAADTGLLASTVVPRA
ncbi:anti-sigma-M factor RsmA, partial [Mycobacterium tuberculosis]|nr:anti-sigma-M factor RsmA [Mycobacterium tuberculosis]